MRLTITLFKAVYLIAEYVSLTTLVNRMAVTMDIHMIQLPRFAEVMLYTNYYNKYYKTKL